MRNKTCAGQYAKALFELEEKVKKSAMVATILETIVKMMQEDPKILLYFNHPEIPESVKKSFLEKWIFEKSVISFLLLLIKKRVMHALPAIFGKYKALLLANQNVVEVTLITAKSLSPHILDLLKKRIDRIFQKKSIMKPMIDPTIGGGAILIIEHRLMDFSVRGRLQRLKKTLLEEPHAT